MSRYNTLQSRFIALTIDSFAIGFISFFFESLGEINNNLVIIVSSFLSINVFFVYRIYFHNKSGQTPGKRVAKIQVVDRKSEAHISNEQAFMREVIPMFLINMSAIALFFITGGNAENFEYSSLGITTLLIPSILIICWYLSDALSILFNSKDRSLHDLIADTTVVKK